MISLMATKIFAVGSTGFYFIILILAVIILALYLWGNTHREKDSRADHLQKKYCILRRDMLDTIPDEELVDAIIANLHAKLDKHKPDAYKTVSILSRGRCVVYSVWLLCNELKAEGLQTYLRSSSGQFIELAGDGMELIGASSCAEILRTIKGLDVFDEERLLILQEKLMDAVEIEKPLALCRDYIRTNPNQFVDVSIPVSGGKQTGFDTFAE